MNKWRISLAHSERRQLTRFPLEVLASVQAVGAETMSFALTRNVSARGIYFYTRTLLKIGQELECILILPENVTSTSATLVACQGEVVRLNTDLPGPAIGVAVEVHGVDFSRFQPAVEAVHPF
jgi:hypothetical protein